MTDQGIIPIRLTLLVVVLGTLCAGSTVAAPVSQQASTERPVYLDIQPAGDFDDAILGADDVAAMAREALAGQQQAVIRMKGPNLPANVRVLRILYIVHRQRETEGMTLAASASTALLRTADEGDGVVQTFSIYSGLQQTLVQGPSGNRTAARLRRGFKQALQARIVSALEPDGSD